MKIFTIMHKPRYIVTLYCINCSIILFMHSQYYYVDFANAKLNFTKLLDIAMSKYVRARKNKKIEAN